jgi:exonuclease VII small subunit
MTIKEIVTKLESIEGSLDDAFYSLPEYNANTDTRDYIDTARTEVDYLKYIIEKEESNV